MSPSSSPTVATPRPPSPTTERAVAFVAARRPDAEAIGAAPRRPPAATPTPSPPRWPPDFERLADPSTSRASSAWRPGIGTVYGVRWPLMAAIARGFRDATRQDRATPLLFVADRLFAEDHLEPRWFAFGLLERTLADETERTWQLLRRAARESGDWITVDSLAHPYGKGVAAEAYRWAELEQLVYSPSRWERRLVGSTIATMTHVDRRRGRDPEVARRAIPILGQLIGDAEPDVQKALSWAYRSLARGRPRRHDRRRSAPRPSGPPPRTTAIGPGSSATASRKLDPAVAADLRGRLDGIRKRPGAPTTSTAAETAARFGELPDPAMFPEPPLA